MEKFSYIFTIITFVFALGSMFGWCLELVYRRFFSKNNPSRKWINPGFLVGPCLPIYGFGLIALFVLSLIPGMRGEVGVKANILTIIAMGVMMTVIEYIAGMIFIKGMNIKLWDYSKNWGNIQGVICPLFSFFWTVLAAGYYFLIQPRIVILVKWLLNNIFYGFFVGVFFGIFIVDLAYSLQVVKHIKAYANEKQLIVKYDELKAHIKHMTEDRVGFLLAFKADIEFSEILKNYEEKYRETIEYIKMKTKKR